MAGLVFKLPGGGQQKQPEGGWTAIPMENRSAGSNLQKQPSDHLPSSAKLVYIPLGSLSLLAVISLKYFGMFEKGKKALRHQMIAGIQSLHTNRCSQLRKLNVCLKCVQGFNTFIASWALSSADLYFWCFQLFLPISSLISWSSRAGDEIWRIRGWNFEFEFEAKIEAECFSYTLPWSSDLVANISNWTENANVNI